MLWILLFFLHFRRWILFCSIKSSYTFIGALHFWITSPWRGAPDKLNPCWEMALKIEIHKPRQTSNKHQSHSKPRYPDNFNPRNELFMQTFCCVSISNGIFNGKLCNNGDNTHQVRTLTSLIISLRHWFSLWYFMSSLICTPKHLWQSVSVGTCVRPRSKSFHI